MRSMKDRRRSAAMPPTSLPGAASARAATEVSVIKSSSPETTCRTHHSQSDRRGHPSAIVGTNFYPGALPRAFTKDTVPRRGQDLRSVIGAGLDGGEGLLLLDRRFLLMLVLPLLVRHAVDDLAGVVVAHLQPLLLGGGPVPFRQTVAAEAGKIHQVDVLHIATVAQMLDQLPESRSFQFGACPVVQFRRHRLNSSASFFRAVTIGLTWHLARGGATAANFISLLQQF